MPAIAACSRAPYRRVVDYILPVKEIAHQLVMLIEKHQIVAEKGEQEEPVLAEIQKVLAVVRTRTGHDFSQYKKNTMHQRIRRRMRWCTTWDVRTDYVRFLQSHPEEVNYLFKELLITVTSFFREPEVFGAIKVLVSRPFSTTRQMTTTRYAHGFPGARPVKEAYSLVMLIREFAEEAGKDYKVQVFATDIDDTSIIQARTGFFPSNIALNVLEKRLTKYFVKEPAGYRVRKDIRESIVFATQDLVKDASFTHLDIVSCQNALIYMESDLQNNLPLQPESGRYPFPRVADTDEPRDKRIRVDERDGRYDKDPGKQRAVRVRVSRPQ